METSSNFSAVQCFSEDFREEFNQFAEIWVNIRDEIC